MRSFRLVLFLSIVLFLVAPEAAAQVPTYRDVMGRDFGERITQHHEMVRYVERVAEASPRVIMEEQGYSWGGRSLVLAIVTAPENHARLDEIKRNAQRLGDPRTLPPAEADRIIPNQPAVVWLGGSIHGFELSGTEGLLKLLEHLTSRDDPETMAVLRNTVILIDPILNPDGRDAFAHQNHVHLGREVTANPHDWTNSFTSWQGLQFRTGHYFFDTNRDWFAHTQLETRNRLQTLQEWRPQAGVDAHEMGSDVEFYVDPPTDPVAPYFPEFATRWFDRFAAAHARAFDEAGVEYMTAERYNFFYPGYTTAYLSYQGAVGMLYEQGSSRGLALERPDGSVRTLGDAMNQQYTAAWAMVRLCSDAREELVRDYYEAHRGAIAEGERGIRRYIIGPGGDPHHVAELVNLLERNGVEVHRLTQEVQLGGLRDREGNSAGQRRFAAGTYVVEAAQPRNRLIRTLLEPDVEVPESFLELARERVDRGENPRFYDITAWSLPLLFNVEAHSTTDARSLPAQRVTANVTVGRGTVPRASYAYLIDGSQARAVSALYHLRAAGHRASFLHRPTRISGRPYAAGTVIVRVGQNEESVHQDVRELAERLDLSVSATGTGLGDEGAFALGSGDATFLVRKPRIAMLAEDPIHAYSFGWAWYVLDRQYEIPATILRTGMLANTPLDRYDVIVLPEVTDTSALARIAGREGLDRVSRWVRDGGTLVTIGSGTDVARKQLGLINLRSWYDEEENEEAARLSVPGAVMNGAVHRHVWLTAGLGDAVPLLVTSNRVYLPPKGPPSGARRVAISYSASNPRISGHAWDESIARLPGAVFAYDERVGRGRVIAFAEDVNFRAYWRGADRLFLNAVVLGPSAP